MKPIIFSLILFLTTFLHLHGQKTDPYHLQTGGFGYMIERSPGLSLWWCEGAYKIMRDTPLPAKKGDTVFLWSARNEYEPFQLVINTESRMEDLRVNMSDMISEGNIIKSSAFKIRKVDYVKITKPTDSYGYSGYWPDPLPEVKGPVTAYGGENTTFWVTLYVPADTPAGIYRGSIRVRSMSWEKEIPVALEVWDFTLPETTNLRSGFGLSVDKISAYHNLKTPGDIKKTFDLYMQAFKDYKIAPYDPFYLYPVRERITGLLWEGGIFDYDNSFNGDYSLMIVDDDPAGSPAASYMEMIDIDHSKKYNLRWLAKGIKEDQPYCILLEAYNGEGKKMVFENKLEAFTCDTTWGRQEYTPGMFGEGVSKVRLYIFPAFRTAIGEDTGRVWIDNIVFTEVGGRDNILDQYDFEVDIDKLDIELDFTDFDMAGMRYLDDFGFNSFRLYLKGMGSGTYYSRNEGIFEGFRQGSPAYERLMDKYLRHMQQHLEERGWLGKEYVYWFDEPGEKDYPFVREGMEIIKRSAPLISTFLTENEPGPEIMDVTDISCTIFHRLDPARVKQIREGGQEYWSYLCTAPKAPWLSLFIDHDAINMRMWSWITYSWGLNGILVWSTNYWNSYSASPAGYLQDPWAEPASFVQGYGWPYGKQTVWGNGDGRLFYPPNRDPNNDKRKYISEPVPSLRLEFLRQGIEDYEYLIMLNNLIDTDTLHSSGELRKARKLLDFKGNLFTDGRTYTKNPGDLLEHRKKLAEMITKLNKEL